MAPRPNFNLFPPGGYVFTDKSGRLHEGTSWPDLARKLKIFRSLNGQPEGDPEAEVYAQFCERFPDYCGNKATGGDGRAPVKPTTELPQRVMNWLGQVYTEVKRNKFGFVAADVAAHRAEVCANCPRQQHWRVGCMTCNHNFDTLADDLLKGRAVSPTNARLLGCASLDEDTKLSAHLNQPPKVAHDQPDFCWRRNP